MTGIYYFAVNNTDNITAFLLLNLIHDTYCFFIFAELCKTLCPRDEINLVLDGPAVNRRPPRKERKKLPINQTSILFALEFIINYIFSYSYLHTNSL